MVFKINISEKGKTYYFELDSENLIGMKIGENIKGETLLPDLKNYELKLTGASDKAGFPSLANQEGTELRKVLLTYSKGFKKKPKKEGKKKKGRNKPKGLRMKKSVRGNTISGDTVQINFNVLKAGEKTLAEVFPDQVKGKKEKGSETSVKKPAETTTEKLQELKPEEKQKIKEETKPEEKSEE